MAQKNHKKRDNQTLFPPNESIKYHLENILDQKKKIKTEPVQASRSNI